MKKYISIGILLLGLFIGQKTVTAQTFYRTIDATNDAKPNQSYEINGFEVQVWDNITRIVIDSNFPLMGMPEIKAKDGRIGAGDILIKDIDGNTWGIKFAPNETTLSNGVYSNVVTTSKVRTNYGARAEFTRQTNIVSGEFKSDINVFNYPGIGTNDGSKIIIEIPNWILPEGQLLLDYTLECANDAIKLSALIRYPTPDIPIKNEFPPMTVTPEFGNPKINMTEPDSPIPEDDNGLLLYIGGGLVFIAILILLLSGGGGKDEVTRSEVIPQPTPMPPDIPDIIPTPIPTPTPIVREIGEDFDFSMFFVLSFMYFLRKKGIN